MENTKKDALDVLDMQVVLGKTGVEEDLAQLCRPQTAWCSSELLVVTAVVF